MLCWRRLLVEGLLWFGVVILFVGKFGLVFVFGGVEYLVGCRRRRCGGCLLLVYGKVLCFGRYRGELKLDGLGCLLLLWLECCWRLWLRSPVGCGLVLLGVVLLGCGSLCRV